MKKDLQYYKDLEVFTDDQLQQIHFGLIESVDVSVYADPKFNWQQMKEIRQGLRVGVDVTIYVDPRFTCRQMRNIRMALYSNEDPTELLTRFAVENL